MNETRKSDTVVTASRTRKSLPKFKVLKNSFQQALVTGGGQVTGISIENCTTPYCATQRQTVC